MKNVIYPGSFDPITNGHLDVIDRALKIFDKISVVVLRNLQKQPLFTLEERVDMLKHSLKGLKGASVDSYEGLLSDYVKKHSINVIVRGLRAISDFEYEFQMALMNRKIMPEVETIFMMPHESFSYLSSKLIKEMAFHGGDVSLFVPPAVLNRLKGKKK